MLESPNASGPSTRTPSKDGYTGGSKPSPAASSSSSSLSITSLLKNSHSILQKHPKEKGIMELSKPDLMKLLGLLEAELQARDLVINSLKNERTKLLKPSKNHHRQYTLANPYTALVRDSEKATGKGDSDEEKTKGTDTKDVVASLHAVIEHHRKAEERLKNQVQTLKTSHTKAVNELEDEKRRHAQDTAQGDDVTYMLEKERERLMQQVDFEKAQQSKLEKECKRSQGRLIQERKKHAEFIKLMFDKHLLLAQQLGDTQQRAMEWETQAQAMRAEAQNASKLAAEERNKSVKMEAEMEKKLSEFDIEREQLFGRLQREEMRTKELREELESLKKSSKKLPELVNGRAGNSSELNSNLKGSSAKSISISSDSKTTKGKETPGSVRKPAVAKPKASAKIYGAKGYKTPPQSDKSEASSSSSSSSEDINVTVSLSRVHSVSPAAPSPKSNPAESKKPSITSKPKPGTTNFSRGAGKDNKPLSPASSLDKLSGKTSSASSSSGMSQKGTKIPSSSAMFANSSQLRKSAPTVAVVAPQPSKASNISQEASKQQPPVKKSLDSTDLPKTDKSEPKSNVLSRPTTLASGDTAMKAKEPAGKVSQLRNTLTSPRDKDSRDKSPTRGFVGMNVKAAAAQLTSPVGKKVFNPVGNTPNKLNSSTSSEPSGATQTKEAPTSVSSTAVTDKVKPVVTSPSSITPGKRNVSPRGTPPPIPPNKPSLIPHKSQPSLSSSSSSSAPPTASLSTMCSVTSSPSTTSSKSSTTTTSSALSKPISSTTSSTLSKQASSTSSKPTNTTSPLSKQTNASSTTAFSKTSSTPTSSSAFSKQTTHTPSPALSKPTTTTTPPAFTKSTTSSSSTPPNNSHPESNGPKNSPSSNSLSSSRKSDSLVEARKQLFANKLGSGVGISATNLRPPFESSNPMLMVNNSNSNSLESLNEKTSSSLVTGSSIQGKAAAQAKKFGKATAPKQTLSGSPPSLTRPTLCPSAWESPLHQAARQGDTATLCRLIEEQHDRTSPEKDGSTLIHAAAYGGQVDSIDLLVTLGEDPDTAQSEGLTPLHVASGEGHEGCVRFLSEHGCNPLSRDSQGWQPIHWAAASGHASCVRTLLDNGSKRDCITNIGWTPFHASARYGQMGSLHALLYHTPTSEQPDLQMLSQINQETTPQPVSPDLLNMMDHDGWTLAHILASTGQKEMLVALHQYGGVHLAVPDRRGRTPCDVASDSCREFLSSITEGKTIRVIVDASQSSMPSNDLSPHLLGQKDEASQFVIGQLSVLSGMTWSAFDLAIGSVLANSCKMPESDNELPSPNSDQSPTNENSPENIDIGLGVNSIHSYVAGNLHWSVGETPSMQPHEIFNLTSDIVIKLHGNQNGRLDQLAFETFLPLQMIQTYVRIIKQYKSVLLYGSPGSGKSRLAVKLAQFIQAKNKNDRVESDMTYASLNSSFTHKDLCKLLLSKGFLIQAMAGKPNPSHNKSVHILVLDGLDKVGVAGLFADLLPLIENRSNQKTVRLQALSSTAMFTLHENSIIIGTVDGVGPGTDLTVQQHFRWIRVDWDQEPFRSILPRYLFRRLIHEKDGLMPTSPSDETLRVLTWVCGIWKRLNDALTRLSMPEFSTGPKQFFACCINGDAPMSILKWLCLLWNCSLAPHIEDTFHHNGPTASSAHIQQQNMAASTALYVLLHKAFLPGCPLSDEEADEYFSGFKGISAPAVDLVVEKSSSGGKKPRRSKSLDRSKTSNKAAALARNQAHMDLISADSQRNGRSMIPRRVNPKPFKTVTKQNSLPISSTSQPSESPVITHQRSQSIPSSPTDDPNLLESLLINHGNPSLSEIEQLIELQKTLFGNGGGGDGEDKGKNKGMKLSKQTAGTGQVGVIGGQRLLRRASDGAPVSPGLARTRTKDEEGVWSVWEETV